MSKYRLVTINKQGHIHILVEADNDNDKDAAKKALNGQGIVVRPPNRLTLRIGVKSVPDELGEEMRGRMEATKSRPRRLKKGAGTP